MLLDGHDVFIEPLWRSEVKGGDKQEIRKFLSETFHDGH